MGYPQKLAFLASLVLFGSACDSPTAPKLPEWILAFSTERSSTAYETHSASASSGQGRIIVEGPYRGATAVLVQEMHVQ